MKMLKEIGLIGLGVMGKNIALNLSDNGLIIKAFNDSKEKLEDIKSATGKNETLRLKREKQLKRNENNLESVLGLVIKTKT